MKKAEDEEQDLADTIRIRASDFVMQQSGQLKEFYKIGKVVGSGSFGEVRICVHK